MRLQKRGKNKIYLDLLHVLWDAFLITSEFSRWAHIGIDLHITHQK